jgi:acyl-coenzyme A synthetase/AMP-(fatty) acid ligase
MEACVGAHHLGLGLVPRDHFGSSENGLPLGNFNALDAEVKPGSMGLPMPGFTMAVVDDDGRELPPGAVGYLAQRPSEQGLYARLLAGHRAHGASLPQRLDHRRRRRPPRLPPASVRRAPQSWSMPRPGPPVH